MTLALDSSCGWKLNKNEATVSKGWKNDEPGYVIMEYVAKLSSSGTWMIESVPKELVYLSKEFSGLSVENAN